MNAFRLFLWILGGALVVGGLVYVYNNTRLAADVPYPLAVAGLAVLVGLMVMGLADRVGKGRTVVVEKVVDPGASYLVADEEENRVVRRQRPSRRDRMASDQARTMRPLPPTKAANAAGAPNHMAPQQSQLPQQGQPIHPIAAGGLPLGEATVVTERIVHSDSSGEEYVAESQEWHLKPHADAASRPQRPAPARRGTSGRSAATDQVDFIEDKT